MPCVLVPVLCQFSTGVKCKYKQVTLKRELIMDICSSAIHFTKEAKKTANIYLLASMVFAGSVVADEGEPLLGFEIGARTFYSNESDCDEIKTNTARLKTVETQASILTENNKSLNLNISQLTASIKSIQISLVEEELTQKDLEGKQTKIESEIIRLSDKERAAREEYRACLEVASRNECLVEYAKYVEYRDARRLSEKESRSIKSGILDSRINIDDYKKRIKAAQEKVLSDELKIDRNNTSLSEYSEFYNSYVKLLLKPGEQVEINLHGDINEVLSGKNIGNISAFYNSEGRASSNLGLGLGVIDVVSGNKVFRGTENPVDRGKWPVDRLYSVTENSNFTNIESAFAYYSSESIVTDVESSCLLRKTDLVNHIDPLVHILVDEYVEYPLKNSYTVNVEIEKVVDQVLSSANDHGYISSIKLSRLVGSLSGVSVNQIEGSYSDEESRLFEYLKQDLLYFVASSIGAPVVSFDQQCESLWCDSISGWWLATPESGIFSSDGVAEFLNIYGNTESRIEGAVYLVKPFTLNLQSGLANIPVCNEDQELVDGVCNDIEPECLVGQELVDGVCKDIEPVCLVDQELVDGVCKDIEPECLVDQELVVGVCKDIEPECLVGQELVDGVCKDIEPECLVGQELVDGVCKDIEPECLVDQELVDGVCKDIEPECLVDQELVDGVCKDIEPECLVGQELVDGVCKEIELECLFDQELVDGVCRDLMSECEPGLDEQCSDEACGENEILFFGICIPESWFEY